MLRDRKGVGGSPLPLGNRRAIDALIATHGVVMDATARVLWVSEGPHLVGRFVRFDLARLLDPSFTPTSADPLDRRYPPGPDLHERGATRPGRRPARPHHGRALRHAAERPRTFLAALSAAGVHASRSARPARADAVSDALAEIARARASLKTWSPRSRRSAPSACSRPP